MPIANESWRTWMLRKGSNQNMNRPVDPAESEVTQWLNPRKRNDPWPMRSGVISICGKRICGNAWSRPPCQRGQQINCPDNLFAGDSRQGVTIVPESAANSYWVLRIPPTRRRGQQKRGRKNPTQHSYHITAQVSSQRPNGPPGRKSVFSTKANVCIWETFRLEKLEKACYYIATKRRYKNSKSSGGLPKAKVNNGNQSDFKSK